MDIEILRALCLKMPKATETIKWEHNLVFAVGGKMFCITHFEGPSVFSVKVPAESYDEWTATPGIIPAPYLARAKWIQVQQPEKFSLTELEALVRESYKLVVASMPKKMKNELGIAAG